MTARAYQCDIVTDEAGFAGLEEAWTALHRVAPDACLSDGFQWARLSWELVCRPRGRELLCLVVRHGAAVAAIWPLAVSRRGGARVAGPLNSETTEYCPFLVDPAADPDQVWRAIRERLRDGGAADLLSLTAVREEGSLGHLLAGEPRAARIFSIPTSRVVSAGAADLDDYLSRQSRGLVESLRRDRRRLAALGEPGFHEAVDAAERQAIWSWMLSTKRAGLARRGLRGDWFDSEAYARFVAASLDRFGPGGGRRIFALRAGDRLVAAALCNVDAAKVEAFVTTYDPACAAWSPGKLLLADIVRWAFARGLAVDLRAGHEPYKARWANRTGQVSFYVLPLTRRGAILARMDAARRWARRSLPPGLRASMARLRGPPG